MAISNYIFSRLLQAGLTLFFVSICVFVMVNVAPGGPISGHMRQPRMSAERLEQLERAFGLDEPIPIRYGKWFSRILQGDLGYSLFSKRPVIEEILARAGNTFYLMTTAFLISIGVALPVGILSALKQYSAFDITVTSATFIGQAIPEFWLGILLVTVFYGVLNNPFTGRPLLPAGGMYTLGGRFDLFDRFSHLILPVIMLTLPWISWYSRFVRSSVLDVMHEDYITTARAKGLPEKTVVTRHMLKNAVPVLITLIALDLPYLFAGSLYAEIIFSWPGMGRLFYDAATKRDYPVLMGVVMLLAFLIVLSNAIADLMQAFLDPRVRLGEGFQEDE